MRTSSRSGPRPPASHAGARARATTLGAGAPSVYESRLRPPPLRTDGSNAFAHFSMTVRVPKILDAIAEQNPDYPPSFQSAIASLKDAIVRDRPVPPLRFPALDEAEWPKDLAERTWLSCDWFFAECYLYRSLMAAVRFWESGRDPFAPVKREELESAALWEGIDAVLGPDDAGGEAEQQLATLLGVSLWGNRVDLSYAVGAAFGRTGTAHDLLSDDRAWGARQLLVTNGNVHIIADNTGSELSMDLIVADAVIALSGASVSLHVKAHPTFVSDATVADVWHLVSAMHKKGGRPRALAARLRSAFEAGKLRVLPDFFWNGPRFLWERPARVAAEIDEATMVVLKGDANYRRAVGDALWAPETSLTEVTAYFPAPMLFLRTLKSDSVAGLAPGLAAKLDTIDPEWRINARRGVIQRGGSPRSGSGRGGDSYSK